jgi:hypothetical protein
MTTFFSPKKEKEAAAKEESPLSKQNTLFQLQHSLSVDLYAD